MRRFAGKKLEVGEAQPQDAEDRPNLIADEEGQGRREKQPLAGALPELGER
jgi:hypothetical protein